MATFTVNVNGTLEVLTGLTLWVDSVNGDDNTAVRGDQAKQYLTLEAASVAAQSGDLIHVRPGTYTPADPIGKDGVNWHFEAGAIVNMSAERFGIFDDKDGPVVCTITGYGQFIRSGTPNGDTNIVRMVNAGSDIAFEYDLCDNQVATEATAGDAAAIYHAAGKLTSRGRKLKALFETYYWIAGPGWLHVYEHTESGHHAVYCVVPDGNTDEVYFRCPKITAANQAIYTFRENTEDDGSAFRLWVVSESITAARVPLQIGPGKVYVTAQKLGVSNGSTGQVITISQRDGDELYVNTQKIGLSDDVTTLGSDFRIIVGEDTRLVRIACQEIDLSGVTSSSTTQLIQIEGSAVDFELRDATLNAQAAIDCPIVANVAATGRRAFVNCRFTNVSPEPFVLTDDITVLQGCDIQTDATNSFTAVAAQTVVSLGSVIHDPLHANVTALGDLLYDTGAVPTANHVAKRQADGTWIWAVTPGIVDGATLVTGLTFPNEGLKVKDTVGDNLLTIKPSVDMTGDRTLSLNVDANVSLQVTGNVTLNAGSLAGVNTGDQTSVSGNAGTATALQTARNINGVAFNGTSNIIIGAPLAPFLVRAATPFPYTNLPAAANFFQDLAPPSVFPIDLTYATQARIFAYTATTGSAGSKLSIKYKTGAWSATAGDYSDIGTSEVACMVDSANTFTDSGWINLTAGAKADIHASVFGLGGNGTADPTFNIIGVQFR